MRPGRGYLPGRDEAGAMSLRGILDHRYAVSRRDIADPVHLGDLAVKMDRHDRRRLRSDRRLQQCWIEGVPLGIDVQ